MGMRNGWLVKLENVDGDEWMRGCGDAVGRSGNNIAYYKGKFDVSALFDHWLLDL
jgi:hypothetical protein